MDTNAEKITGIMKKWGFEPPSQHEDWDSSYAKIAKFVAWADKNMDVSKNLPFGLDPSVLSLGEVRHALAALRNNPELVDRMTEVQRRSIGSTILLEYANLKGAMLIESVDIGGHPMHQMALPNPCSESDMHILSSMGWVWDSLQNAFVGLHVDPKRPG